MIIFKRTILTAALACAAGMPNPSIAQVQSAPNSPAPASAAAPAQDLLKAEQLDQLLAPIALYPDNLLAQTLMASTYPLEVVEASRWADDRKNLKGEQLKNAGRNAVSAQHDEHEIVLDAEARRCSAGAAA
jgi:hypothetical protein